MAFRVALKQLGTGARSGKFAPTRRFTTQQQQLKLQRSSFQAQARSFSTITKYLESHEYVKLDNGVGTIGITDFAQSQLGDVVFVDLPERGDTFEKGEAFGSVESVKAASDVYMPVGGEIIDVNESLMEQPELVNSNAMNDAWFVKVKVENESEMDDLLDQAAYEKVCEEEADH
mmetsp:Transcript_3943/g.4936  ORF Transcript_3943/g.4936 Transcript_3943/m.4936 type:complete len:174 (+) Transcript_3943:178-699(+)|eukprot:CAMPEP_0204843762 /NCGR_PEP_ID=MMETSP1346-20131115/48170_1 /ASSEMBLY_ACC=CAM_ASM_000771 /TAXON_ID=215587 /ORGANISM="Aplanochytrium stocchinoi, Strain GSBS06" /LENGTH=173 /DNA_ID=CAMNT_0051982963 /DNA_START=204 /DNA_END=725 /DNA_ORIENTATION=+